MTCKSLANTHDNPYSNTMFTHHKIVVFKQRQQYILDAMVICMLALAIVLRLLNR